MSCGKYWHTSINDALLALSVVKARKNCKRGHSLSVYECSDCEGWHIGHDYRLERDFGISICVGEGK